MKSEFIKDGSVVRWYLPFPSVRTNCYTIISNISLFITLIVPNMNEDVNIIIFSSQIFFYIFGFIHESFKPIFNAHNCNYPMPRSNFISHLHTCICTSVYILKTETLFSKMDEN